MSGKELLAILKQQGCQVTRTHGSHFRLDVGKCHTTVPVHAGETLGAGLVRCIERDLEPCLGKKWLRKLLQG